LAATSMIRSEMSPSILVGSAEATPPVFGSPATVSGVSVHVGHGSSGSNEEKYSVLPCGTAVAAGAAGVSTAVTTNAPVAMAPSRVEVERHQPRGRTIALPSPPSAAVA